MKPLGRTATLTAILALFASPALAQGPPEGTPTADDNPGTYHQDQNKPAGTPTQDSNPGSDRRAEGKPTAEENPGTARKVDAPGRYCKDASKKRVKGEKGTAFSACVKAQARLRSGAADTPREACKGASKKRVKGEKGTAYSTCVKAAAQLLKDQKAQEKTESEQGA